MTTDQWVSLHTHTEFSMLDGAAKIKPLFTEAARLGQPAMAITDHGNMHGAAGFYRASQGTGVKPIIGIEAYVAPQSRHHKKPVFWGNPNQRGADQYGEGGDVSGAGAYLHMTMLAENATGLRNLFRLSTLASFEGFYYKPRMDRELIARHYEGIIATTGCPSGEVQTRLRLGHRNQALQAASDWKDIFGAERYFLELMDHGLPIERSVREDLLTIGRQLGLRPVATNDSHYVTRDQAQAHAALLCVQTGKTLDDPTRFKFDGDSYYLKSAEEMRGYWDTEVPGACDTTLLIAERVEPYGEVFAPINRMPRVPLEPGETEDLLLRREVEAAIAARFPAGVPAAYRERVEKELGVIADMGFAAYFLIVADLVRWAHAQGIPCRGRGSAAGSLVTYLQGVTDLDPIEHGLFFERFLNPDRVSPPDIDMDIHQQRRGELLRYLTEKWGADHVAQVVTFGTIKTKAALKDAARVLYGQEGYAIADRVTRALPRPIYAVDIPLAGIFDRDHERWAEASQVRALIERDPDVAKVVDTARDLEGLTRNAGVHACGVVLSSQPLIEVLPLWARPSDGLILTGWDFATCENVGLLKVDALGLRSLTVVDDTLRAVRERHGITIDLNALPLDDEATYRLLASGHTTGVFQLDGAGIRDLLRHVEPTTFADVSAVLALYRPGPMAANAHNDFAARKNGHQDIKPIHPELAEPLADILSETHGLCIYQETVMAIARRVAGYSLSQADLLRRAIGKKKKEILDKEYRPFASGMRSNGYSEDAITTLWNMMVPFSSYAFVKSHAASYAIMSYWTAYLKAHYPAEFMAAQLTSIDKPDKRGVYLAECRRMGLKILSPDVNESVSEFTACDGGIRVGLKSISGIGDGPVRAIAAGRAAGPYVSFTDFLERVELAACSKQVMTALIAAGAFDSLGHRRQPLADAAERAVSVMGPLKRHAAKGQPDLFSATQSPLAHLVLEGPEWPRDRLLARERDMLGMYVSGHPLDGLEAILRRAAPDPIATLAARTPDDPPPGEVAIAGIITKISRKVNKKGEPWAVTTVEDLDDGIEVVFFARTYAGVESLLVADTPLVVTGRAQWREDTLNVIADTVTHLGTTAPEAPLTLRLRVGDCTPQLVNELRAVLLRHPGRREVRVRLLSSDRRRECLLGIDDRLRVTSCPELKRDLQTLLEDHS